MPDEIDQIQEFSQFQNEELVRKAVTAGAHIPVGIAGECKACGEHSPRLVANHCAPCRDEMDKIK